MPKWTGKVRGELQRTRDRKAARLLASGLSYSEVAQLTGLAEQTIANKNAQDPKFKQMVEKYATKFEATLEDRIIDGLIEAEEDAVETMRGLMADAQSEEVRFKAAESILDRAGRRGKAAETKQIATLNLNEPIDKALQSALADPTVRKLLDTKPELRKQLLSGVIEEAEIVESE